jgi:Fanconi anemia group M protein
MKEIFNIFQKKETKIKEIPKPTILADYREKNCFVASELFRLGINVEFRELKVADYLVNDVAIERKTVSDFISSMINKRLLSQLEELQQYENKLLIIEGIDEQELYTDSGLKEVSSREERIGVHPNSVRGFLLSILLKHKVPIIFTKDSEDTAKFISVLAKRKPKELSLNVSKKSLNKKERLQFILEGFPGIGPKSARKLLEKFKTIKNIINASEEELKEVLGKKAKVMKRLVEETYD